jgi:hypothetical protein
MDTFTPGIPYRLEHGLNRGPVRGFKRDQKPIWRQTGAILPTFRGICIDAGLRIPRPNWIHIEITMPISASKAILIVREVRIICSRAAIDDASIRGTSIAFTGTDRQESRENSRRVQQ